MVLSLAFRLTGFHPLYGTVSVLCQLWICLWHDPCSGDWPAGSSSRRDAVIPCCGRFHEGCISPDIVIYLSCILDEFVGHVVYVSSLGAGRISLKEVYVFVRTAEAVTMQRVDEKMGRNMIPSPAAVVPTWPLLAWLPASSLVLLK